MSSRAWSDVVHVWSTSEGADPRSLEPGRDVVLDAPRAQGASLPHGVLLDDLLPRAVREEIDRRARAELEAWRISRDSQLTIDGVCLPHIWEVELLAEVFLPETRVVVGLHAALGKQAMRQVVCEGFDEGRLAALRWALERGGIVVSTTGPPAAPVAYPSVLASPWRPSLLTRAFNWTLDTVGAPKRVRGDVYLFSYWHLVPVYRQGTRDGLRFVVDPRSLPGVELAALARSAAQGGWVGHPAFLARRRARRAIGRALSRTGSPASNALGRHFDSRALEVIAYRAAESLAVASTLRRAFARRKVKLAVLPFDSPPNARLVVHAAREAGIPTLVVQHGFPNGSHDPDRTLADAVAVWAESDVAPLQLRRSGGIVVTGNPGAASAGRIERRAASSSARRTIVLVEYASRLSALIDSRVSIRHVDTALRALAKEMPGTDVVIRPHPAEHEPEIFGCLADSHPTLQVLVDAESSIAALIETADLCIGAVSTATLQAGAAGLPVVFLNVTDEPAPWPFDGTTEVPVASNADDLAALVRMALSSEDVPGRNVMLEALGAKTDAVDRVIDLIRSLAQHPHP